MAFMGHGVFFLTKDVAFIRFSLQKIEMMIYEKIKMKILDRILNGT